LCLQALAIAIANFIIWFNIMGNVTMALITTGWSADYRLSVPRSGLATPTLRGQVKSRKRHFD